MRLSAVAFVVLACNGCSLIHSVDPDAPRDMSGCMPSPACSMTDAGMVDMHVGDDLSTCEMICPSIDMAPDLRPSCLNSSTCDPTAPVCMNGKCSPCVASNDMGASSECMMYHAPANLCDPSSGGCVQCLSKDDCQQFNQTCILTGPQKNTCGQCTLNTDCTTGVCKSGGACASPSEVAYVDRDNAACSDLPHASTPTAPFCQITTALSPSPKPYTVVAGSATAYNAVTIATAGSNVGPLALIGPGHNAAPTAKITQNTLQAISVTTTVTNTATVTVDGFELIGSAGGTNKAGVSCSQSGGAASLKVINSYIHNSGGYGVDSSGCALTLDANIISSNQGGGVSINGGSIVASNNLIVGNGTGGPGVSFGGSVSGTWWFNTVASNSFKTGPTTNPSAFTCSTTGATLPVLQAGIVWGNDKASGASFDSSRCVFTYTDIDDTTTPSGVGNFNMDPMFTGGTLPATSFRIPSGSPCKDKITAATGLVGGTLPNHDVDGNPRPRMATGGYDCGASQAP